MVLGPQDPNNKQVIPTGMQNHWIGAVEDEHLDPHVFDEQYMTFHTLGYSYDPTGLSIIGNKKAWEEAHGKANTLILDLVDSRGKGVWFGWF